MTVRLAERVHFSNSLANIKAREPDIVFAAITVRKERANKAFRQHPNRLYNFMTKLLLLDPMSQYDSICLIPDARSIKIESKYALHDSRHGASIRKRHRPADDAVGEPRLPPPSVRRRDGGNHLDPTTNTGIARRTR